MIQYISQMEQEKIRITNTLTSQNENQVKQHQEEITQIQNELEKAKNANSDLKDRLEHSERILLEMETELFQNPYYEPHSIPTSKPSKSKKSKKSKEPTSEDPSQSLSASLSASKSIFDQNPPNPPNRQGKVPSWDFVLLPSRLVALIVQAKKSEAHAMLEMKRLNKQKLIAEETTGKEWLDFENGSVWSCVIKLTLRCYRRKRGYDQAAGESGL